MAEKKEIYTQTYHEQVDMQNTRQLREVLSTLPGLQKATSEPLNLPHLPEPEFPMPMISVPSSGICRKPTLCFGTRISVI